jgi:UDP-3-O-[3-hydroxymyristoyl] glucosamine N-acyltransferase
MKDLKNVINKLGLIPAPFSDATEDNFTFLSIPVENTKNPIKIVDEYKIMQSEDIDKQTKQVIKSKAGVVICSNQLPLKKSNKYFQVDYPKYIFYKLMNFLYPIADEKHPSVIYETDKISIGKNVSIGPNCIIGAEGFGMGRTKDNEILVMPQIGGVIIEDNVSIYSNTIIDRGTLGDTIIGSGTKIDRFVHIAHNSKIGNNCVIVSGALLCGSVIVGDNTWIGPSSSILNGVKVGNNCVIGMGSMVVKDVPDGATVKGVPAK